MGLRKKDLVLVGLFMFCGLALGSWMMRGLISVVAPPEKTVGLAQVNTEASFAQACAAAKVFAEEKGVWVTCKMQVVPEGVSALAEFSDFRPSLRFFPDGSYREPKD